MRKTKIKINNNQKLVVVVKNEAWDKVIKSIPHTNEKPLTYLVFNADAIVSIDRCQEIELKKEGS